MLGAIAIVLVPLPLIVGAVLAGQLIDAAGYRIIGPFCLVILALGVALMTQVRPQLRTRAAS